MGIEKQLARLTTQTTAPRIGAGGVQELTSADIARSIGHVTGDHGAYLVLAKYCANAKAERKLIAHAARCAWRDLRAHRGADDSDSIDSLAVRSLSYRIAQVAIVALTDPALHRRMGTSGFADWAGVSAPTWRAKLRPTHDAVLAHLQDLESTALWEIRKALT